MSIQRSCQQNAVSAPQEAQQGIHKTTVIFCIFTTALLLIIAFLMNQIGHTPWGITGAVVLLVVLTTQ